MNPHTHAHTCAENDEIVRVIESKIVRLAIVRSVLGGASIPAVGGDRSPVLQPQREHRRSQIRRHHEPAPFANVKHHQFGLARNAVAAHTALVAILPERDARHMGPVVEFSISLRGTDLEISYSMGFVLIGRLKRLITVVQQVTSCR